MILAFDWTANGITVGIALVGLVGGYLLRGREWTREKRLEIYDRFLAANDAVEDVMADRHLHNQNRPDDATKPADVKEYYEEASRLTSLVVARLIEFHAAGRRVRFVGSRRVVEIIPIIEGAMHRYGSAGGERSVDARVKAALPALNSAQQRFLHLAALDVAGAPWPFNRWHRKRLNELDAKTKPEAK